ncbi:MAG: bifunctional phosphoribosyl-AMP cyclohydrolase/phosphoribosyl-ATP diphosphatase HisIE [Vicinamibacteria bacterium]|nr:bifunctional phosphoribosyl-AMP cyclohydrolase/phosphoribosyl-ATP diphosphatase HisIE [Vicinamibacteria bacterium]
MSATMPRDLKYDASGLIPVVVQDVTSGDLLMVGYANDEALRRAEETGYAHFWSRSRRKLWKKGETSGNVLRVREARTDCDRDVILLIAEPAGPTCHTGMRTCFGEDSATDAGVLAEIERVIADRAKRRPEGSYTVRLLDGGLDRSLEKIGEEATELVLAAKGDDSERVIEEAADLLFHLEVALAQRGVALSRVLQELKKRRGPR